MIAFLYSWVHLVTNEVSSTPSVLPNQTLHLNSQWSTVSSWLPPLHPHEPLLSLSLPQNASSKASLRHLFNRSINSTCTSHSSISEVSNNTSTAVWLTYYLVLSETIVFPNAGVQSYSTSKQDRPTTTSLRRPSCRLQQGLSLLRFTPMVLVHLFRERDLFLTYLGHEYITRFVLLDSSPWILAHLFPQSDVASSGL